MKINRIYRYLPFLALLFAIIFNMVLLRHELFIKTDPNDNIFQFTLVNRVNTVWESYGCPINLGCWKRLFDHWVPEWAEGYPLPFYYSHIPQIAIISTYHLINDITSLLGMPFSLFGYYHAITWAFLVFFPIPVFFAVRIIGFSPLVQIFAALFASHISTDGLYGMDNTSYLWRGYGLSSQLFATFFMPMAFAYVFRALKEISQKRTPTALIWAILFLTATISSHLGLGYIALVSLIPLLFMSFKPKEILARIKVLAIIVGISLGLLAYWVIPFLSNTNYYNMSAWDPVWKFNSFGYFNVLTRLFHGELIDFGRARILTVFTFIGFFVLFLQSKKSSQPIDFAQGKPTHNQSTSLRVNQHTTHNQFLTAISYLFPLWLLLFFGRTTWGSLMKLLPGAESFHLHRFLNGLHLSVLFLAPVGAAWLTQMIQNVLTRFVESNQNIRSRNSILIQRLLTIGVITIVILISIRFTYDRTIDYARPNAEWLIAANKRFDADWPDFKKLTDTLNKLPHGRIYPGKPGYWGKDFRLGDTQMYMALSVRGYEVSQFLPETWSPNSDTEQFFDERVKNFYDLYNLRYVISPYNIKFPDFVRFKNQWGKYVLWEVDTGGYFTIGRSNIVVHANRTNYANIVHLWQTSSQLENNLFPIISFNKKTAPSNWTNNSITITNSSKYRRSDGKEVSMFDESPFYVPKDYKKPTATFGKEYTKAGQEYVTTVTVPKTCTDCFIVFKMTYHPNWHVYVDGKSTKPLTVFPFFTAIPITPGKHTILAKYQPSQFKILLLLFSITGVMAWVFRKKIIKYKPDFSLKDSLMKA